MGRWLRAALLGSLCIAALGGVSAPAAEAAEPAVRYLASVSCPTATTCFAVGASDGTPLIERWNGSTWSVVPSPAPAGGDGGLLVDVSCTAVDRCVAVGYTSERTLLIEHWNGRKWTIRSAPGARHKTSVGAVSCATPSACVVVGERSVTGTSGPFALRWNGAIWATMATPPMNTYGLLLGVSCPDTGTCVAVGWRQVPLRVGQVRPHKALLRTHALLWKRGSGWSVTATPKPQGDSFAMLRDVSCPTPTRCHAAGMDGGKHRILAWNGTKWSVAQLAPQARSSLNGISCPTTTSCFAVGSTAASPAKTVIERWDGTKWSVTSSPSVAGTDSILNGVSCVSEINCHAVGGAWATNGTTAVPLTASWDGTRWSRS